MNQPIFCNICGEPAYAIFLRKRRQLHFDQKYLAACDACVSPEKWHYLKQCYGWFRFDSPHTVASELEKEGHIAWRLRQLFAVEKDRLVGRGEIKCSEDCLKPAVKIFAYNSIFKGGDSYFIGLCSYHGTPGTKVESMKDCGICGKSGFVVSDYGNLIICPCCKNDLVEWAYQDKEPGTKTL